MLNRIVLCTVMLTSTALAQQPSPLERALSDKLLQEINASVQCSAALITAQDKLKDNEKEKAK